MLVGGSDARHMRSVCDDSVIVCDRIAKINVYFYFLFFFNDTATTEIYTLSLHDALPISDATNELTPQSQVTFAGIGPIQIGMTVAEAEAAANIELVVRYFDYAGTGEPSRCAYARPTAGPPELALMVIEGRSTRVDISYLTRQEVDGQPVAVEVESSQITTPEGIGLWTSEADVSAAYPEAEITLHPYVEGHCLTVIDPNPPYHSLIFETNADQGNQVMNFRSGRSPEVQWIEGCS